jgi:hypothetical protein
MADEPRRGWQGQPKPRSGPPMRSGMERRALRQLYSERIEDAMVRASTKSWWPRVVERRPFWSGGHWCWVLRPVKPAHGGEP